MINYYKILHICKFFRTFAPDMKKETLIGLVLAGFLLSGCQVLEQKQQAGAVVEVHGNYLYRSSLDALTAGMNSEDSARVAQEFITQWAKDILIYEAISNQQSAISQSELDQMVEDYRRTLYTQAYEEWLVNNQMPKSVPDSVVEDIYRHMPNRFLLKESMIKGLLVVVPKDAPNISKLRKWMEDESLDEIEKYAYQIALGYELFSDKWLTTTDIISKIPLERDELETRLKAKNQIEVSDSLKTYLIQVTDKQLRGGQMPVERAREEIEKIVLNERQVEFLQQERNRIYEEAVKQGDVKFLE